MVRPLIGAPLHSDGKLTIVSLAAEAGLRRNKLTHKHTDPKDLFYPLVRVRAERDDLRSQAQLLARIVQVLEIENHQLKEADTNLRGQLAAQGVVRDLTQRPRT
ncbi:hypothetical protein [Streptomyces sp. NPDC059744]|uniref:hypothetical protein n=1 Tax=Streptomyces sp. NPDC059744 TaxID=3346929 RepID=UPI00365F4AA2